MRNDYQPGDRVYRWWDSGIGVDLQPLTVIRINRLTVSVETDHCGRFRMNPDDIAGRLDAETDPRLNMVT